MEQLPVNPMPAPEPCRGVQPQAAASRLAESANEQTGSHALLSVARHGPTLLVMALLAGIGLYGHASGWKAPTFSSLTGKKTPQADDWCEDHAVPESQCVECHPELLPGTKDHGWCQAHGVANCPLCHPDVAQLKEALVVAEADRQRAARALAAAASPANNPICKNYRRRIQFASQDAIAKAGVDVALVDRQPIAETVAANGQITYDQTRFASLSPRLPGTVRRVERSAGDRVRAGELLALVDAADVGRAKSELVQALAREQLQRSTLDRVNSVANIVSGGKIQEAQAEYAQAQARLTMAQQALVNLGFRVNLDELRRLPQDKLARNLAFLGLPESIVERLDPADTTSNLLPVKAPLDGILVVRAAVAGEVVDNARVLFQLADTSQMWLTLAVPLEDAGKLLPGQSVRFRPDGCGEEAGGKLAWISTAADPQTRMVAARVELPNPKGQLRNGTFGAGTILLREDPEAIVVPSEAIHWEGCCHVVFVRDKRFFDGADRFRVFGVRTVRPGTGNGKFTEIIAGLLPGEVVAAQGSDVLRAQLLKNRLGEGCCCGK